MKKILFLAFATLSTAVSGQSNYDVGHIPKSLMQDAAAIIRLEDCVFDITSSAKAQLTYKVAITILNKAGDTYAEMTEIYDRFSTISNISATLYDASGKVVRTYKKADIQDRSLISDFSIYEDNRLKYLTFAHVAHPYTIEYSYTKEYKGFLSIPSWRPIRSFGIAVEKSSYTILCPPSYAFKKLTSAGLQADSVMMNGKIQHKWVCDNLPALVYEPYSAGLDNVVPWVSVSPTDFEYDGTHGSLQDWNQLGRWLHTLNEGGSYLNETTKNEVRSLIKNATTDDEKIRILYNYLQQNTRYVSVQLGIGGFKPISADNVAQVNYGDCKALSNFMKALLHEAGITSNLVVIGNGLPSLNAAYASFGQANHMILCVPQESDTTFLECTSHHYPMGFIGHSNAGRTALMVDGNGGRLINTTKYTAKDNYLKRNVLVSFAGDLTANIDINTKYGHAQFADNLDILLEEPSEQRKGILENLGIPGMELVDYSYLQPDKIKPELTETIKVTSKQLLSKGGDRIFLTANLLNRREHIPPAVPGRKTDFALSFDYMDEDEIIYNLPEGYDVEHLPKDVELVSEFGTFSASYIADERTITYRRTQVMNSKKYPPEKYSEFVEFCKQVYQSDKQKVVLIRVL
ncbi:DUF3857 domain-containing protein [Parapedobacter sp. DT-150]|uniref:DUF3857 domain-containing protein n=1 Tax=Parapedobacter sp. DT-150 TaxID=3396162 RepID=UPI003F1B3E83